MNKSLLAAVVLLPVLGGVAFAALAALYPGKTTMVMLCLTGFTLLECVLLAAVALSLLKKAGRKDDS